MAMHIRHTIMGTQPIIALVRTGATGEPTMHGPTTGAPTMRGLMAGATGAPSTHAQTVEGATVAHTGVEWRRPPFALLLRRRGPVALARKKAGSRPRPPRLRLQWCCRQLGRTWNSRTTMRTHWECSRVRPSGMAQSQRPTAIRDERSDSRATTAPRVSALWNRSKLVREPYDRPGILPACV